MKDKAITMIAVGHEYENREPAIRFAKSYAEKIGADFLLLDKELFGWNNTKEYNYGTFEKFQVFYLFDRYERIIRLDSDVLIRPDCPNLFEMVSENKVGAVFEDVGSREGHRHNEIRKSQEGMGDVGWIEGYFNSGVMVLSRMHAGIVAPPRNQYIKQNKNALGSFKEQTLCNWRLRQAGFEVDSLSYRFNHIGMFSEEWNGYADRRDSYIIHYAGPDKDMPEMQDDAEKFEEMMNDTNKSPQQSARLSDRQKSNSEEKVFDYIITLSGGIGNVIQTTPFLSFLQKKGYRVAVRNNLESLKLITSMISHLCDEVIDKSHNAKAKYDLGKLTGTGKLFEWQRKMPEWQVWFKRHIFTPPKEAEASVDYDEAESPSRIVLAPCCKPEWIMKRWPHWNELISRLPEKPVVMGVPLDGGRLEGEFIDYRGQMPLREFAGILADADYVIAEEGGIAHLACAVGTTTYILVGGTSFPKTQPPANGIWIGPSGDFKCRPCWKAGDYIQQTGMYDIHHGCKPWEKIHGYTQCMDAISVDKVTNTISEQETVRK